MPTTTRFHRFATLAAFAAVACLSLLGLSSFGIWDPWEVEVADPARRFADGQALATPPTIGVWLVAEAFRLLGVHEWSGRLAIALGGIATLAMGYALVARFSDRRTAVYCVVIAGTSPLYLFNARTMLGEAPAFALQTAIVWTGARAVFGTADDPRRRFAWLLGCIAFAAAGVAGRGALLCSLPALLAVACAGMLDGRLRAEPGFSGIDRLSTLVVAALALVLAALCAHDILIDDPAFSWWLGGTPDGGQPPSFDVVIERAFHAFAPWSALLPLGIARLGLGFAGDPDAGSGFDDERRLRALLALWIGFAYGALTLYLSRYGHKTALMPVVAFAAAVALLLRDVERSRSGSWSSAVAAVLLTILLVRDFALLPNGSIHGLPIEDFKLPEVFNPRAGWALVLTPFALTALAGLGAYRESSRAIALAAPYRFLREQWGRGLGYKLWLCGFALVLLGLELFGIACFIPKVAAHLNTRDVKIGKALALVPVALPLVVAAFQLGLSACAKLGSLRSLPVLCAGVCVGGYAAFGFMPALSEHFSPREVYETYNALAKANEPLVEYKVGARAAAYYAKGEASEVDGTVALMAKLAASRRVWAVFPSDELAGIDKLFRSRTQRHLFVADARNSRAMLATNQPIPGRQDESFLSKYVRRDVPAIQHRVSANFEDKIELLGYDLKMPGGDHVGASEHFVLTWYFKVLRPPGDYRVFVHIDADAARIHGDHDPIDGKYPVRLWEKDDVIVDRQELQVPASYDAGRYTIFMGFYSGETRLVVKDGPNDGGNRVIAGVLQIR